MLFPALSCLLPGWDLLQSLRELGMEEGQWQFVDVYGLDPSLLSFVPQPVLAVLLLFPLSAEVCISVFLPPWGLRPFLIQSFFFCSMRGPKKRKKQGSGQRDKMCQRTSSL